MISVSLLKQVLIQDNNPSHKCDYREAVIKNVGRLNRICVDHKSLRTGVKQEVRVIYSNLVSEK